MQIPAPAMDQNPNRWPIAQYNLFTTLIQQAWTIQKPGEDPRHIVAAVLEAARELGLEPNSWPVKYVLSYTYGFWRTEDGSWYHAQAYLRFFGRFDQNGRLASTGLSAQDEKLILVQADNPDQTTNPDWKSIPQRPVNSDDPRAENYFAGCQEYRAKTVH